MCRGLNLAAGPWPVPASETETSFLYDSSFEVKSILFLALAAAARSFTSCGSKQEGTVKKEGDAVEVSADAKAAGMETAADSTKKAGEAASDAIKDNADRVDVPAASTTTTTTTEVKK